MAKGSEDKKSFVLYGSYAKQFEKLSDAAAGQLIKAIFAYMNNEPIPEITDSGADMAFSFICSQLDRDREAYDRKCEINRKNGGLGGRPPKNRTVIEKPNGFEENRTVIQTELEPEEKPQPEKKNPLNERFEQFWTTYPKKVGKKAALNAWQRIRPDAGLFDKIIQSVEAAKLSEQWQKENGRYIPNPATWLNQGRWDDELVPSPTPAATDTAAKRSPVDNPWKRD